MGKRKLDNGFTLIEMILVLFIVSILLLLFPMMRLKSSGVLRMQVEALRYQFIKAQSDALHNKITVSISCDGTTCVIDETIVELSNMMRCYGSVKFNENGNASRATTFTCEVGSSQKALVVQLGSGRMYVR